MKIKTTHQIDMCQGPILSKMILFAVPLVLTGILQLLYNAADIIVVGNFAEQGAVSAVSTNGPMINLIINLFMGLSVGVSVTVARHFGAREHKEIHKTVHTAITISITCGIFLSFFGFFAARSLLEFMNSPPDVIDGATLYMQIFFIGMPFNMTYNFGSAILRATGDTRRPLYFLAFSGIINVCLNMFFVIVLQLSVAGVALSTIISQGISACLVIRALMKNTDGTKLILKELRIHKEQLITIIKLGLPAGIQGSMFSLANAMIQSSINSFGSSIITDGNGISMNLEGFLYISANCIHQACVTFTSQNIGARQFKRVRKCLPRCLFLAVVMIVPQSVIFAYFSENIVSIYTKDAEIIALASARIVYISALYFMCAFMDVTTGQLRGLGYSFIPMIISIGGICGFRLIWIATAFAWNPTLEMLYHTYPLSWTITVMANLICYFIVIRKFPKEDSPLIRA